MKACSAAVLWMVLLWLLCSCAPAVGPVADSEREMEPQAGPEPAVEAKAEEPPPPPDLWRFETEGEVWSTPVVRGGVLFVGSDDRHLYALDASTGEQLWAAGPLPAAVRSRPAQGGERVVIVDRRGGVHAFSLGGEKLWHAEVGAVFSAALDGDGVFVATEDGSLVSLAVDDGRRRWSHELGEPAGSPEAAAGRVVAATADGRLVALDVASESVRWQRRVGSGAAARLAGGTVYAAGGGFLWALRAVDGVPRWRLWTSEFLSSPPAVAGDVLLAAAGDGQLWAIDAESGLELWRGHLEQPLRAPPAIGPALAGGAAFLGAGSHLFTAFDLADGRAVWRFETDANMTRALAVAPGRLIFGAQDGAVYGVRFELPAVRAPKNGAQTKAKAKIKATGGVEALVDVHTTPSFHDKPPQLEHSLDLGAGGRSLHTAFGRLYASTAEELIALENPPGGKKDEKKGEEEAAWREVWRQPAGSAPLLLEDASLVLAAGAALYRLDGDGRELWRAETQALPMAPGGPSPIVAGDDAGRLWALSGRDGQRLWRRQVPGLVRQAPVVSGELVFASLCPGGVMAFDRGGGRELWRAGELECAVASPLVIGDAVYAASASGEVVALDAAVGGERWRAPLGGGSRFAPSHLFGMLLIATDDGVLHGLDLGTGLETWREEVGPRPSTPPVLLDGIAHVGSHDGRVYAVNALNGDLLWWIELASPTASTPGAVPLGLAVDTSSGRRLHVLTRGGRLLTFDLR